MHMHYKYGIYTLTLKIWDRLNEMRLFAFALLYCTQSSTHHPLSNLFINKISLLH